MRILYIGEKLTHEQYLKGNVPSHWLYGAIEMERDGHDVIWEQESNSSCKNFNIVLNNKHDLIFIPNLNLHNHLILLLFATFGSYRKPIYAYLHREPANTHGFRGKLYKFLLRGLKHIFFLSPLSMKKVIENDMVEADRCSMPGWGPDITFYKNIPLSDNGYFVSTGKENRDFETLIEAFKITGAPLHIFTTTSHNGEDYRFLDAKCRDIKNIKVTLVENSPTNYKAMVAEMAAAHALVCPLRQDRLTYCVGLSTITDAEGLHKNLIITDNPYHQDRNGVFIRVDTVEDWVKAIKSLSDKHDYGKHDFSMSAAYKKMKKIMKL